VPSIDHLDKVSNLGIAHVLLKSSLRRLRCGPPSTRTSKDAGECTLVDDSKLLGLCERQRRLA
jgi:hypothetical protein